MKVQISRSVRAYDGAKLVWHRDWLGAQWSFWYLVKVTP